MQKTTLAILATILISACASPSQNTKTPQTLSGQLNSCMLKEIYSRHDSGTLGYDRWTIAQEIFSDCKRRLKIKDGDVNSIQSLNIAASTIQSLTQTRRK